jgi:membrane associated rhomboid family serine protease
MLKFSQLRTSLTGFGPVGTAFTIFALINILFFCLTSLSESLLSLLSLSPEQPWGVFSSVFVHDGLGHLASNLTGFVAYSIMFVFLNVLNTPDNRAKSSRMFLLIVFAAGFVTNAAELLVWGATGTTNLVSRGASGMVYAALGVVFASSIVNLSGNMSVFTRVLARLSHKKKGRKVVDWHTRIVILTGILTPAILFTVFSWLVVTPDDFFNVGPGVDVFGHAMGFLLGFIGSLVLLMFRHMRDRVS